ncbi:uncharacterized protein LOC108672342 [Hyalella azteca]|uniref:Uncharacterized protein LOC108672342 n=1 Tax=Hyalella azteca TaxID=294128 RepID=A0A8B7NQX0_HYAAZ|nr:uncharacterized protein LOC108672342 [Hyalella azteca]
MRRFRHDLTLLGRSLVVILLMKLSGDAQAQSYTLLGCFQDNVAAPALPSVTGSLHYIFPYNETELLSGPQECNDECTKLGHDAFGIDRGRYCFCGAAAAVSALTTTGTCDALCADGSTCGGLVMGHFSTWSGFATIAYFNASLTGLVEPYFVQTTDTVTLEVVGTTDFSVDWGDGAQSGGSVTTYKFTLPGTYQIQVWPIASPSVVTTFEVTVVEVPDFIVTCPSVYELNVAAPCNMSNLVQGYNFTFSYSIASPLEALTGTGPMPGSVSRVYGTTVDPGTPATTGASATPATSFVYNVVHGLVAADGLLVKVEATTASGDAVLDIRALTPACATGQFCRGSCGTDCVSACSGSCGTDCVSACSGSSFCPGISACSSACPLTAPSGYELVSLGTVTVPATGGVPASVLVEPPIAVKQGTYIGFVNTAAAQFVTQPNSVSGDLLVAVSDTTLVTATNVSHSVRFYVEEHPNVGVLPDFNCTKPSVVPVANVPTPYDVTTEQYANESAINISISVTSPMGPVKSDSLTALCQVQILPPTNVPAVIMAYGSGLPLDITFTQGAPIVMFMNIDGVKYYSYHDDASVGGSHTWSQPLLYPMEGQYTLVGEAFNALNRVNFTSFIRVIPNITDLWTLTAACPCYDWDSGYTLTLSWPATAHPPWNATINITDDIILRDGSQLSEIVKANFIENFGTFDGVSLPGGASGAAVPLTWSGTVVSKAGNHSVVATLANEVSVTTTLHSYEVREAIRNVSAIIKWVQDGNEMDGVGPNFNIYIVDKRVIIYPTARTGEGEYWRLRILENGLEEIGQQFPYVKFFFNVTFPAEGNFTLIVSGNNTVQGWIDSPPINITLVNKIANFRLEDDLTLAKPGVPKQVLGAYDILTPISCLVVDWGDKSPVETYGFPSRCNTTHADAKYMGPLNSAPVKLMHTYQNESVYEINALAFDLYMNLPSVLEMVVADIDCMFPWVSIVDAVNYTYFARNLYRMLPVREEGMSIINCNSTYTIRYEWNAIQVEDRTEQVLQTVTLRDVVPTWNNSLLSITPFTLSIGYYKLTFSVTIVTRFDLTRTAKTYVRIIKSPLSPVMVSGSQTALSRGFQQTLSLEPGSLSYDPDDPDVPIENVTWHCRQIEPIPDPAFTVDANNVTLINNLQTIPPRLQAVSMNKSSGCFGNGSGTIDVGATSYLFDMATFSQTSAFFEMVVVINKDDRTATAALEIEVTPLPRPSVTITCATASLCWPLTNMQLINPSLRLGLNGACIDECGDGALLYTWSVLDEAGTPLQVSNCTSTTANDGLVMSMDPPSCEESFPAGTESSSLAIAASVFAKNPTVERYNVRLTIVTADGRSG